MNILTRYIRRIWRTVVEDYLGIVGRAVVHRVGVPGSDPMWVRFLNGMEFSFRWADLLSAAGLRRRIGEPLRPPDPERVAGAMEHDFRGGWAQLYNETVERTTWAPDHVRSSLPFVVDRAAEIMRVEHDFVEARRAAVTGTPGALPLFRLEMHRRHALKDIAQTSEQIELAVPRIGGQFPFVVYNTRDDRRVRPTHAIMQGFVALRSWSGWPIIRPPCGWNCRCMLRYVARFEARKRGWLDKDGRPTFEVKWPSSMARINYESGLFPDPNTPFAEPKVWAGDGELLNA